MRTHTQHMRAKRVTLLAPPPPLPPDIDSTQNNNNNKMITMMIMMMIMTMMMMMMILKLIMRFKEVFELIKLALRCLLNVCLVEYSFVCR